MTARASDNPALTTEALVACEDVRRSYGRGAGVRAALSGVSLTIARGEFVAIVGASGSGKSTLLSVLGGLDRGYEGRLSLFGRAVEPMSDRELSLLRRGRIGFVFQAFHLLPHLDALANVTTPALFGPRVPDADDRARAALARVGIADRAHDLPETLSGGQRQRVALARALLLRPDLLLCDEPTGNLDAETGAQVIDLFRELSTQDGVTIVVVTHEPRLAAAASRTIQIADGRIAGESASAQGVA